MMVEARRRVLPSTRLIAIRYRTIALFKRDIPCEASYNFFLFWLIYPLHNGMGNLKYSTSRSLYFITRLGASMPILLRSF